MNTFLSFQQPIWLLLFFPLLTLLYLWRVPSRFLMTVRFLCLAAVVLAMAAPVFRLPLRGGTVIVVADRSRSMPDDAVASELAAVRILAKAKGANDRLGVVSFAKSAAPEHLPTTKTVTLESLEQFVSESSTDASDIHAALEQAISLLPAGDVGRILLISDGRWTGENPLRLVPLCVQRGIALDYRLLERPGSSDIAIVAVDAPGKVLPNEIFTIHALLSVPQTQEIEYELLRNDVVLTTGKRLMRTGDSRLVFRDSAKIPGTLEYSLRVKGVFGTDPIPENNTARRLVGVEGTKPLLLLAGKETSQLPELFQMAGVETQLRTATDMSWNLVNLSSYSGIVLENQPAGTIGTRGMELLAEWVRQTGSGLMVTGGKQSFGSGGYYKSPLEDVLPVSMELRREHKKLAVAICAVLDTSGSMGVMVHGGKSKIDLAKLGAAEIPRVLTAMDEIAVIGYDNVPRYLVHLEKNAFPETARARIMQPGSLNYGIFVHAALRCAMKEIAPAEAETKHIIVFADADHLVEPGDYSDLITKARQAGISVSTIGLGTPNDTDADILVQMARLGGGSCYFTDDPNDLPRIFAQDTMVVAKSTFVEEPSGIVFSGALAAVTGQPFPEPPAIGGYNLCYPKNGTLVAAKTTDEQEAPVIVSWQAGLGRVLCYTGQVDGTFTGPIAEWDHYAPLLASLGRWTAGRVDTLPNNMLLTQEIRDGSCLIRLHLDPEQEESVLTTLPVVTTLRQSLGQPLSPESVVMQWWEPEMLGATIPLDGTETLVSTVTLGDGTPPVVLPPVALPYSPEFRPPESGKGRDTLRLLAEATGGKERIELSEIWGSIPRVIRSVPFAKWFLFAATVLFVLEILERRTGFVTTKLRRSFFAAQLLMARINRRFFPQRVRSETAGVGHVDVADNCGDGQDENTGEKSMSFLQRRKLWKQRQSKQTSENKTSSASLSDGNITGKNSMTNTDSLKTTDNTDKDGDMLGALSRAKKSADRRTK